MFTTGLIRRIHADVNAEMWPFFLKHLVQDDDQSLVYPTLLKMIRKTKPKATLRNQILAICDICLKVNPRFTRKSLT